MLRGQTLTYDRGGFPLFSNLSFALNAGDVLCVRGANGSGKSTLLRLLAGLIPPPPKSLFWKNREITSSSLSLYQQNLFYMGHALCLHPEAAVKDQLALWKDLYKIPQDSLNRSLQTWGLQTCLDQKIALLSQGQKKRLSFSRCGWLKRPLWILDEPQAGLDQDGKERLSHLLKTHQAEGGALVLATHDPFPSSQEIDL